MFFIFVISITKLEGVVVVAVVTGLEVVAVGMVAEVVTGLEVVAVGMVAEVVTGLEVVDVVTKMVVAGVEDAISPVVSPLNSIRSLCPFKMILLLVLFNFLLQ